MNRQSMQRLRLDRRLTGRKGWISEAELRSELEALPDAAHKATTIGEVEDEAKAGSAAPKEPAPSA